MTQDTPKNSSKNVQIERDILKIKEILSLHGMEKYADKIMYVPQVPILGFEKSYIIEEWYGIKVAKLISAPND